MTELKFPSRRVVVFGIDGVRADVLEAVNTPAIDAIARSGFYTTFPFDLGADPISGPGWGSIATGVPPKCHNILDNDFTSNRLEQWPDFLSRLHTANPAYRTYVAAEWSPLVTADDGGPLFPTATRSLFVDPECGWGTADDLVTDDAIAVLGTEVVHAAVVFLGAPDIVGHTIGTGPEYRAAVEAADQRIGRIVEAIRSRLTFDDEEWTFIVTTDHGHRDGGGHGTARAIATEPETTCWIAASGPTVPVSKLVVAAHTDVHPHVLTTLGVDIDPTWGLAGREFGSRSA